MQSASRPGHVECVGFSTTPPREANKLNRYYPDTDRKHPIVLLLPGERPLREPAWRLK